MECAHCELPAREREAVYLQRDDRRLVFCCHGCLGIYQLINEEGLHSFYGRRDGWTAGPQMTTEVDPAFFEDRIVRGEDGNTTVDFMVSGIRCASCVWLIEKAMKRLKGVVDCRVNYATHQARITWDGAVVSLVDILTRLRRYGYQPQPYHPDEQQKRLSRDLLIRFGTSSFLAMQLMLYSAALYAGYFQGMDDTMRLILKIVAGLVATPVLFYGGRDFFAGALRAVRTGHFNMDSLIAIGAGSAYFLSVYQTFRDGEVYYDTAVMIITLILLGRLLENGAKQRASEAVRRLESLAPDQAHLLHDADDMSGKMIPARSVKTGSMIAVKPGERIPLDGLIVKGGSEVDESMLTGESMPVSKEKGGEVRAGTMNLYGHLVVQVTKTADKTMLAQIIRSVEEAQARRAPVQKLVDRVVGYFVPGVLVLAAAAFLTAWHSGPIEDAVIRSVSVLVVACPCALGLATPLAILIGTGLGARMGILYKGGDILEQVKGVNMAVLDKTGTLTTGFMSLVSIIPLAPGWDKDKCLLYGASLEAGSEHPLGRAIVSSVSTGQLKVVNDFEVHPGKGISGTIDGFPYWLGNRKFLEELGLQDAGKSAYKKETNTKQVATIVTLADESGSVADFHIADTLRPESKKAVDRLKELGIEVAMLSGDHSKSVAAIAREIGITEFHAEVLPHEKVSYIEDLRKKGRRIAMVGDGINDAPALTVADVGIVVAKGSDIAMESGDIVLMREDLDLVSQSIRLARATFTTIRLNLFWALGYNIIVLPIAFMGLLHPILCAGAMALSSLCVVTNSLLLRRAEK